MYKELTDYVILRVYFIPSNHTVHAITKNQDAQ